jgi:hypothetical protein
MLHAVKTIEYNKINKMVQPGGVLHEKNTQNRTHRKSSEAFVFGRYSITRRTGTNDKTPPLTGQ